MNWELKLHFQSVKKMPNIFAAKGHVHYGKSNGLYHHQVMESETDYPWVYHNFIKKGYHTIHDKN